MEDDEEEDEDEEQKKPGRRKISIQFIEDKSKRHITFSKRKTGVIKKAKELSSLTGAHVVLLVASETGNLYDFATPRFSKVLDELKTWFHSCKKDAARIEAAAGFSLQAQTAPQFVDVEGLVDDDVDEEVELESQKRISALMQAANTAELAEREHNEMAAAAWSLSPGRKRARDWGHEGYAERPGARNGEQGAKQHNSNQNYLMLQMMNPQGGGGSGGDGQRAHSFGHSDQGPASAVLAHHASAARGWHPRDPLPQPTAAAMGQGGASAQAKLTTDYVAETDFAGVSQPGNRQNGTPRSRPRVPSPIPGYSMNALNHGPKRKAVMHHSPAWAKRSPVQPAALQGISRVKMPMFSIFGQPPVDGDGIEGAADGAAHATATENAGEGGAGATTQRLPASSPLVAGRISVRDREGVELLATLATHMSPAIIPRLRKES